VSLLEENNATVIFPRRGKIEVATGKNCVVGSRGDALLFTPNMRRTIVAPDAQGEFEAIVALVPFRKLGSGTGKHSVAATGKSIEANLSRLIRPGAASTLQQFCQFLRFEGDRPRSALARGVTLRSSEAMLIDLFDDLLLEFAEAIGDKVSRSPRPGSALVRMAEELMRSRAHEPVSIGDIARELGVGHRALQLAFQNQRDMTPREALSRIRLERARAILQQRPGASVTEVAFECGFQHLGRFSRNYRQFHGELPSETARAFRRAAI
jgi:AraC-like DNA-binding protein